jgi:hypothetical protein
MRQFKAMFAAAAVAALAGCASVPMESLELDAKAKAFVPLPDKAALYIYRNETFGAAVPMNLSINGRNIGQSASKTYFQFNLVPGRYSVESTAENVAELKLQMEPGKNYFVWQEVKMGMWMARSQLHQVDEATGRAGVQESKLATARLASSDLQPLDAKGPTPTNTALDEKLRQLQKMYDDKLISEQEYQTKRKELLEKF